MPWLGFLLMMCLVYGQFVHMSGINFVVFEIKIWDSFEVLFVINSCQWTCMVQALKWYTFCAHLVLTYCAFKYAYNEGLVGKFCDPTLCSVKESAYISWNKTKNTLQLLKKPSMEWRLIFHIFQLEMATNPSYICLRKKAH